MSTRPILCCMSVKAVGAKRGDPFTRYEDTWWTGGIAPHILKLGIM